MLKLTKLQKEAPIFWYEYMVRCEDGSPGYEAKRLRKTFSEIARSVGEGWEPLLEDLCVKLLRLGWSGGLAQIKEKFGTLRFYWRNDIKDEIEANIGEDLVNYAEDQSGSLCEVCGKWGKLRGGGWVYTACDEHTREGDLKHESE